MKCIILSGIPHSCGRHQTWARPAQDPLGFQNLPPLCEASAVKKCCQSPWLRAVPLLGLSDSYHGFVRLPEKNTKRDIEVGFPGLHKWGTPTRCFPSFSHHFPIFPWPSWLEVDCTRRHQHPCHEHHNVVDSSEVVQLTKGQLGLAPWRLWRLWLGPVSLGKKWVF